MELSTAGVRLLDGAFSRDRDWIIDEPFAQSSTITHDFCLPDGSNLCKFLFQSLGRDIEEEIPYIYGRNGCTFLRLECGSS